MPFVFRECFRRSSLVTTYSSSAQSDAIVVMKLFNFASCILGKFYSEIIWVAAFIQSLKFSRHKCVLWAVKIPVPYLLLRWNFNFYLAWFFKYFQIYSWGEFHSVFFLNFARANLFLVPQAHFRPVAAEK